MEESYLKKEEVVKQITAYWKIAVFGAPTLLLVLFLAKFVFGIPFSNWVFAISIYFILSIFMLTRFESAIALTVIIIIGMVVSAWLLYLFMPFMINLLGSIVLMAFVFYTFFIANIFSAYLGKRIIYVFLFVSCLSLSFLIFLEYLGIYPKYPAYPIKNHFVGDNFHLVVSFIAGIGGLTFFTFHINNFITFLRGKIDELNEARNELAQLNIGLEGTVKERTAELEEAKTVLEIKVQARTRESARLAESLETEVQKRTKELQNKIEEFVKFGKLAMGREIRFKELQERANKLKGKDDANEKK